MKLLIFVAFYTCFSTFECAFQDGPDPWHYKNDAIPPEKGNTDDPPDLRMTSSPPKNNIQSGNVGIGHWFFKRMLAIVLKGGQYKKNEDSSIDVSVQMRFDESQWSTLNQYLTSNTAFSEEMFRRSVGYVENAIYKPSISEKISMAWKDYIQHYLVEYKMEITMALGILAAVGATVWLWNHMSHKHFKIILFVALYLYEVFVSYKEADQKEFDRYWSAINTCKWYFWSSNCEVPPPNPINFLKHMNPLKIAVRMFTTIISEPMITISATVQTIIHGITDGLWFPLDKIMQGVLTVLFNAMLVILLVMIVFTYLLRISFNLSFLAGLVSIGVNDRRSRTSIPNNQPMVENGDRISVATLDKILDVCSRALTREQVNGTTIAQVPLARPVLSQISNGGRPSTSLKKSASTGRLQDYESNDINLYEKDNRVRNRKHANMKYLDGSGDAR